MAYFLKSYAIHIFISLEYFEYGKTILTKSLFQEQMSEKYFIKIVLGKNNWFWR